MPPRPLRLARTLTAIGILEAYDVVELWSRDLDDIHIRDRDHAMDRARRAVEGVASGHSNDAALGAVAHFEIHLARFDEEGLVFRHVVLT